MNYKRYNNQERRLMSCIYSMYNNYHIQEYANSYPRQLVQNLISAKYRTRQL